MKEIERVKSQEQIRWEGLSTGSKIKEWAMKNQYKVIVGSWAVSMGIAGAIVMANKHQTNAQKIVQARMWAQGLTIGVLIGAGVLTQSQRAEAFKERVRTSPFLLYVKSAHTLQRSIASRPFMGEHHPQPSSN